MKKIIIIIILFLLNLNHISLAQNNMIIQADKNNIKKDEQVQIKVKISNTDIASLTLQIYFDTTKLEFISGPENSNYINNSVIYTWVDEQAKSNTQIEIGDFVFKAFEKGTANIIVTGEFYNSNEQSIQIPNNNIEIKIYELEEEQVETEENVDSNNTNLKILRLNHEGITPQFNKDIKQYYFIADASIQNLDVTAIPENKNVTVTITGNDNLKLGLNVITISVETKDKLNKSEYKINVTKATNIQEANANLETLAIRQASLAPEFNSNIYNYKIEIPNNIDKIDILAIPQSLNANVTVVGNNTLNYGENKIEIIVTAEDKITKKTYQIIAYRRNEQEEIKKQEEQQVQAERLSTILEEQDTQPISSEQSNTISTNTQNNKKHIFIPIIIIITVIIIAFVIFKKKIVNK